MPAPDFLSQREALNDEIASVVIPQPNEKHMHTIESLIIETGLGSLIVEAVNEAEAAYLDAERPASVTIKIGLKFDNEKACGVARARIQSSLPRGDADTVARKLPGIALYQISSDHPGQQRIGE